MTSSASTVEAYLASQPEDRRAALSAVRETILAHLPDGYEEGSQYGMIGYYVPHSRYPAGYHCNPKAPLSYAALGAQKNYLVLHLPTIYGDEKLCAEFRRRWEAAGKRLDMGKGCVRFRKLEDVPLDVVGWVIAATPVDLLISWDQQARAAAAERRKKR